MLGAEGREFAVEAVGLGVLDREHGNPKRSDCGGPENGGLGGIHGLERVEEEGARAESSRGGDRVCGEGKVQRR